MSSGKVLARSLAIATAIAAFMSFRLLIVALGGGAISGTSGEFALGLAYVYLWALQAPVLAPFFARYPLAQRPGRHGLYYAAVGIPASVVPAVLFALLETLLRHPTTDMRRGITAEIFAGYLIFWVVAGIFQAVEANRKARDLEVRLAHAELQNLKSQLQPHFLFNTLHTVSVLMRQDVEASNRVLLKLSDLLRVSLDHNRADQITLQQELDFIESYLDIEQTRFQERLRVSIDADADARAALIPTLLLQPFVENAVRHGIAPRAAGGSLTISARRNGDTLALTVEDDGAGLAADFAARRERGSGIRNSTGRLRALYGVAGRLDVSARPAGGVAVTITLPYRV